MTSPSQITFRGNYIKGQFVEPSQPDGQIQKVSPGDLSDQILTVDYSYGAEAEACSEAKKAFAKWSGLSMEERMTYMNRLKEVYQAHVDEMAEVIARETGKPLWEATGEVKAMISKIDITLNHSLKLIEEMKIENALPQVDGFVRYKPRGVMAVIGPFNFPGHLPNGHIVPALVTGNTVVFKPSELTPAIGQLMAEMFDKAEFPAGVFNLVQGDGEVGRRLVIDENVDGVLFTGSYEVGLKIKKDTTQHYWKLIALEMGGKNVSLVWKDADLDKALYESVIGCFVTAGQRCSCTSRLVLHEDIADQFTERFYQMAKKLEIGHWSKNPFMGPLISNAAVEKYIRFQEIAKREDSESMMRGKALELQPKGHYVTPSINLVKSFDKQSVYQSSEIFGPNVAVYRTKEVAEAIDINNSSGYGLSMAVFSKDKQIYQEALQNARVGLLNWNRTTNGASSRLPFGGMNKSGNDRPSAHFAVYYCTVPVASLEDHGSFDESQMLPGLVFES